MMRSGRLLAQDSPANLLRNYRLKSLEDVFLKLCMKDGNNKRSDSAATSSNETAYTVAQTQSSLRGIDNMAFNNSASQFDVSQASIGRQYPNRGLPGSLACYTVVSKILPNINFIVFSILQIVVYCSAIV